MGKPFPEAPKGNPFPEPASSPPFKAVPGRREHGHAGSVPLLRCLRLYNCLLVNAWAPCMHVCIEHHPWSMPTLGCMLYERNGAVLAFTGKPA